MIKKLSIIAVSIMLSTLFVGTGKANSEMIIAHHHQQNTGVIIAHHHRQNIDRIDKKAEKCNKDCQCQKCKKDKKCACDSDCPKKNNKDKKKPR